MPHQTGPTTAAGKSVACQNAYKHGMTSRQILVTGESERDYATLQAQWHEAFPTSNAYSAGLVTKAANSEWLLRRIERSYDQISQKLFLTLMTEWTKEQHAEYQRITRYLTTNQRALERDRRTILQYFREVRADARAQQQLAKKSQSEARRLQATTTHADAATFCLPRITSPPSLPDLAQSPYGSPHAPTEASAG